jgi:hypothetical protein
VGKTVKCSIRLIHTLARSGGTLLGRCLGAMDGVFLLSEINPRGLHRFNPLVQAHRWFGLLTEDEVRQWADAGMTLAEAMDRLSARAEEKGGRLVVRDWSHMDFMALPFADKPTNRLTLVEALRGTFSIRNAAIVRHPADQTESLVRTWPGEALPPLGTFLRANRDFAEVLCAEDAPVPFFRYEDFTRDPDGVLRLLCETLDVPFDAGYADRWGRYDTITGDVTGSRGGLEAIRPLERNLPPPEVRERLMADEDYLRACALLGYDP